MALMPTTCLTMSVKHNSLYYFLFAASLCGYPLVAAITTTFGLRNFEFAVVLRAMIAVVSIFVLLLAFGKKMSGAQKLVILLASVFWLAYSARIIIQTLLGNENLTNNPYYYWIWGFGASALPFFALSFGVKGQLDSKKYFLITFWVAFPAAVLVFFNASTTVLVDSILIDTDRIRLNALNPISLGHLGATVLLLSYWALVFGVRWRPAFRILIFTGLGLGVYLLLASNSRGPLLSVSAALMFMALFGVGKRRVTSALLTVALLVSFFPAVAFVEDRLSIDIMRRVSFKTIGSEVNVVARVDLFASAVDELARHPFLGSGIEEAASGRYPHNLIIESYMATGIFFGTIFLALCISFMALAIRLFCTKAEYGWASVLFVQYFVGAQVSGALYSATSFWTVAGCMIFLGAGLVVNGGTLSNSTRNSAIGASQ